ncbi:MAG TPA: hypothetical protein VLG50_02315 [Candidatus Saccharimonadales bacterium]|nr:hypothetical protein [Candidatus Saccharimonadales bacterium]
MKKLLLTLLTMFACFSVQAINIKLLKGTHTIVPADYSPAMGLSFLEWGVAEQWYKLSGRIQAAQLKEVLEKNSEALSQNLEIAELIANMPKNNATENLIMSMFHIAGGTFILTNADGNPVKYLEPHHIGKILKVVQKWKAALLDSDILKTLQQDNSAKKVDYQVIIQALQKETSKLNAEILKAKKASKNEDAEALQATLKIKNAELVKTQNLLKKLVDSSSKDFVAQTLQQELYDLCMSFQLKNGSSQQLFQEKNWKDFVTSLAGSLQESVGDSRLYADNTPEGILLGFMLTKSNTRQDLQDYFKGFLDDETFTLPSDEEYTDKDIADIVASKTNASDFEQFADLLSAYTYKELYQSQLPKMTSNKTVDYKGITFADCVDTVIRMLANIVTYKESQAKVGVVPEGLKLNPVVKNFYQSENSPNSKSAEVAHSGVHQAWAQVIENVPGCIYKNIGNGKVNNMGPESPNNISITALQGIDGVMPIDQSFTYTQSGKIEINGVEYEPYSLNLDNKTYVLAKKNVGDKTYLLVPKDSELVCCELRSNILNIVTGLNHVFDLGLYSNFEQIFEPDFASKNFKIICEKFHWDPQIDISTLDKSGDLVIPIKTSQGEFSINIAKSHGFISVKETEKLPVQIEIPQTTHEPIVAAVVALGIKHIKDLPANLQKTYLYKDVAVLNLNERYSVIRKISSKTDLTDIEKNYLKSLMLSFIFEPDAQYLKKIIQYNTYELKKIGLLDFGIELAHMHDLTYKSTIFLEVLPELIKVKEMTLEQGLSLIEKGLNNQNEAWISERIFRVIIKDGLIGANDVDILLPFLENLMSSSDFNVLYSAQQMMTHVLDKGLITSEQLLPFIEKNMSSSDFTEIQKGSNLMKDLINKGLITLDQILPFIEKNMDNSEFNVRYGIMDVLTSLTDKKMITQSEIERLKNLATDDYFKQQLEELQSRAVSDFEKKLKGLNSLIASKKMTIEQGLSLIENGLSNSNKSIRTQIIDATMNLVNKNLIESDQVPQLLSLIEKMMIHPDLQYGGMSLLNSLINKDLVVSNQIPEILPLLEQGLKIANGLVVASTIYTVSSLVDKKMLTQSEVEHLKNVAIDNVYKQKLEELKLRAPVSVEGRKVEIVKPVHTISKGQRREIVQRMKKARIQPEQQKEEQQLIQEKEREEQRYQQFMQEQHERQDEQDQEISSMHETQLKPGLALR